MINDLEGEGSVRTIFVCLGDLLNVALVGARKNTRGSLCATMVQIRRDRTCQCLFTGLGRGAGVPFSVPG